MEQKTPINPAWEQHYKTLEAIRRSGKTNMFGAAPYLAEVNDIDIVLARQILMNWMQNYNELCDKYGWQR